MGRRRTSPEAASRGRILGAELRASRLATSTSQEELARAAGISTATLRKIEAGDVANPGFFTILSLASALGVGVTELIDDALTVEP